MFMHVVNICSGEVNHAYSIVAVYANYWGLSDEYLIMSMISRHVDNP